MATLNILAVLSQAFSLILILNKLLEKNLTLNNYLLLAGYFLSCSLFIVHFTNEDIIAFIILIMIPVYLFYLYKFNGKNKFIIFYYVLFAYLIMALFSFIFVSSISTIIYYFFGHNYYAIVEKWIQWLAPLFALLPSIPFIGFFKRIHRYYLDRRSIRISLIVFSFALFLLLITIFSFEQYIKVSFYLRFISIFGFLLVAILFFIIFRLQERHFQKQSEKTQFKQLLEYTKELENLSEELSSFRHDYINIIMSLGESIKNQDLQEIQRIYYEVVEPTKMLLRQKENNIKDLANIQIIEVKSILNAKLAYAHSLGIAVHFEARDKIQTIPVDALNFIRMLSILLDNAIEAAAKSQQKYLEIDIIVTDDEELWIIKNSVDKKVEINQIFTAGYSSKGNHRGIGLHSLEQMLNLYKNVDLETISEENLFTQKIVIKVN